jgi:hypothetical protein
MGFGFVEHAAPCGLPCAQVLRELGGRSAERAGKLTGELGELATEWGWHVDGACPVCDGARYNGPEGTACDPKRPTLGLLLRLFDHLCNPLFRPKSGKEQEQILGAWMKRLAPDRRAFLNPFLRQYRSAIQRTRVADARAKRLGDRILAAVQGKLARSLGSELVANKTPRGWKGRTPERPAQGVATSARKQSAT